MSKDGDEQRLQSRITLNKEFESFDAFVHEYVANVSRTGAFIRSKDPLPVGTEVDLRFTVIMDEVQTIEGKGRVVRVQDNPPGMGVVFTELNRYSEALLASLLTSHATP